MTAPGAPTSFASAARRAKVLWLQLVDAQPELLWCVWSDPAAYVLIGPGEQELPGWQGLDGEQTVEDGVQASVVLRHRDTGAGDGPYQVHVRRIDPASPRWQQVLPLLQTNRLHLADPAGAPRRWAEHCQLLELTEQPTE